MIDERAFLAQLESANTDELAQILRRPSADEERVLEVYFGRERLEQLRGLALSTQRRSLRGAAKGNVVVLHGIMGGELAVHPTPQSSQFIWMSIPRLALGAAGWLRMTSDFKSQYEMQVTGMIKKYYAEQLLGLQNAGWEVRGFAYDWRRDLDELAKNLRTQIDNWFGPQAPVNLVAHSMGGLVSRTYILRNKDRWNRGGRLIMLGTPNHGSFAIPQVITGAYDTVRKLARLDFKHDLRSLCDILNTFPGSMQMLPSPLQDRKMAPMFKAALWSNWGVRQSILDRARASHERLAAVVDRSRMFYIAGYNKVTKVGVRDWSRLDNADAYADSMEGDGTVPHALGFLYEDGDPKKARIPTYFIECSHGDLPSRDEVIAATDQILTRGDCDLPKKLPATRGAVAVKRSAVRKKMNEIAEEEELRQLSRRLQTRSRTVADPDNLPVASDEVRAGEILVRSFLGGDSAISTTDGDLEAPPPTSLKMKKTKPVSISIGLVQGRIEDAEADFISVGHYIGVAPQNAEWAIDDAISNYGNRKKSGKKLIITDLCQRGVIVGQLAQNFLLPDPRKNGRTIVIAGMGRPGTFGEAELAVLARELVWTLGRSGRSTLASVLIGGGAGNLGTEEAVNAWLRGIRRALHDAESAGHPRLQSITFVEYAAGNFVRLHNALEKAKANFSADAEKLEISYRSPDDKKLRNAERSATKLAAKRGAAQERKSFKTPKKTEDRSPTRLTIQLQADTFQFAALTETASIPQRDTRIDPALVDEANDQLVTADSFAKQLNQGNLLGRLMLPSDMHELIKRQGVPVVLALDATTARIHWEMMADQPAGTTPDFDEEHFLGTAYGLTRQLRTTFAQLPEPPLLTDRPLHILVVADPAEDAPLPGAQAEGEAVATIFEQFGAQSGHNVVVKRLFGPGQATRVAVLDHLINQRFDMMHYAGHCFYNPKDPPLSGWVFTGGKVLSANELNRVDRVPRFVFSNACESGITPERATKRSAMLAPSFAESFFARGVANFICTAWPVDDDAALRFAQRFYNGILGITSSAEPVHEAMRQARREIATLSAGGMQTWGAYQHYGDPNLRIIPRGAQTKTAAPRARKSARPSRRKRRAPRKK